MNQILYTGETKKDVMDINKVIKIFAIGIIVLGLISICQGSIGIIKGDGNGKAKDLKPVINVAQEDNVLVLNIDHGVAIDKITYSWNGEEEIVLQGRGRSSILEQIDIPKGENTIFMTVTDSNGKVSTYSHTYFIDSRDKIAPEIEFLVEDGKLRIVAKDETALDYISYFWNDEDETKKEVIQEGQKVIEEKISILKGENTLTVIAVDKEGNEYIKEQTYIGAKKPTIEVSQEGDILIINMKDEQGIKKIEYTQNDFFDSTDKDNTGTSLDLKDASFKLKLEPGENKIVIKVYNVNNLLTEKKVDINM